MAGSENSATRMKTACTPGGMAPASAGEACIRISGTGVAKSVTLFLTMPGALAKALQNSTAAS
jgi:hypothetical protein